MGKRKAIISDESEHSSSDDTDEDSDTFFVEVITKARVNVDGDIEYRVKWEGYPSDDDSWEPQENVEGCTRLLRSFWDEIGLKIRDNPGPPGKLHEASEKWIKKERTHFKRKKAEELEEKQRQKELRKRSKQSPKYPSKDDAPSKSRLKKRGSDGSLNSLFSASDEDSDDIPLSKRLPEKKGKKNALSILTKEATKGSSSSSKTFGQPKRTVPIVQNSTMPKNKFAGLKIKKTSSMFGSDHKSSEKPMTEVNASPKPTPLSVAIPKRPFNTSLGSSTPMSAISDSNPANLFLPPRPRMPTTPITVEPPRVADDDVDNFLATVMPFEAASSQNPEIMENSPFIEKVPIAAGLKFEKKWKWSGELFFDTADSAERLCDIVINDVTSTADTGFKINNIMDSKDSLRFSKAYRRSEINDIIRSIKKVDQISRISPQAEQDKAPFGGFVNYLSKRNLVISTPVFTNFGHVAEMIVFPATDKYLYSRLKVPERYSVSTHSLILTLVRCLVPPSKYNNLYNRPDEIRSTTQDEKMKVVEKNPETPFPFMIQASLKILNFPLWFLDSLVNKRYCVWVSPVDPKPDNYGKVLKGVLREDTKALLAVMDYSKAENVGYRADVNVVFIHVGALRTINKLTALVERRSRLPDLKFVTYGSHECVKPSLWGFHEIYPLGGIVTFTHSALLENPYEVAEFIEQVNKHPFWACYILPSVLSVFVRWSCLPGEDPVAVYQNEPSRLGRIMELIEDGKVALMQSPGLAEQKSPESDVEESLQWIMSQMVSVPKTPTDHIVDCWGTYVSDYSNKTEKEISKLIESEIVKDLLLLQVQPIMRKKYRRFVVIKASQENHIEWDRDGFEWLTLESFSFKDGFPKTRDVK